MQAVLPDYLTALVTSAGKLADFLRNTHFPEAEKIEALDNIASPGALCETYLKVRARGGLARFAETTIRDIHTSAAFDSHVRSAGVRESGLRVPRLRALLPEQPEAADYGLQTLGAFAAAVRAAAPESFPGLIDFYFYTTSFAEIGPSQKRQSLLDSLFDRHPDVALRLLSARDLLTGHMRAALRLVEGGLAYFASNRYFAKVHELCQFRLERIDPEMGDLARTLDAQWYADFRLGRLDEALAALDRWSGLKPTQTRPLIYRAIVESVRDPETAARTLEVAGADLGQAGIGGNVLYAEHLMARDGQPQAAERALRRAIHGQQAAKTPTDYLIALHNAFVAQGRTSWALAEVFRRQELDLAWDRFGLDGVRDLSEDALSAPGKVSVVMTAWQAEAYLARAIQGVLEQSHADLELIVVDDCSEDRTAEICNSIEDPRLRYMRTPRNIGTYAAKNMGIRDALSRGTDFVALCDSDDFWLRNHLAVHLEKMAETPEAVCSTSQWMRVRADGSVECGLRGRYVETCPHSTLFRRKAFEAGFFDAVRFGADREFLNRITLRFGAGAILSIGRILTLGRRHDASLTTSGAGAISEFNESPVRLDYWANWNDWHIAEMAAGRLPHSEGDPDAGERPFPAPAEMHI